MVDNGYDAVFGSSFSSVQMSQPAPWAQPSSLTLPIVNNQHTPFMDNAAQELNINAWDAGYPNNTQQFEVAMPSSPFQQQVPNVSMSRRLREARRGSHG
jgi:hypothetical protein